MRAAQMLLLAIRQMQVARRDVNTPSSAFHDEDMKMASVHKLQCTSVSTMDWHLHGFSLLHLQTPFSQSSPGPLLLIQLLQHSCCICLQTPGDLIGALGARCWCHSLLPCVGMKLHPNTNG